MNYQRNFFAALLIFITINLLSCTIHVISTRPEASVVTRTEAPYPNGVWIDSEYRWDGNTYIVVPAHWERMHGTWVPGHWREVKGGYSWVPGHWK